MIDRWTGTPAFEPSRSTTWMRAAPAAAQRRAIAGGSSPNTVERAKSPCASWTQRPSRRSIAGMTSNTRDGGDGLGRALAGAEGGEVAVDQKSEIRAFLRVELDGEDVVLGHDRGERDAVVCLADNC